MGKDILDCCAVVNFNVSFEWSLWLSIRVADDGWTSDGRLDVIAGRFVFRTVNANWNLESARICNLYHHKRIINLSTGLWLAV